MNWFTAVIAIFTLSYCANAQAAPRTAEDIRAEALAKHAGKKLWINDYMGVVDVCSFPARDCSRKLTTSFAVTDLVNADGWSNFELTTADGRKFYTRWNNDIYFVTYDPVAKSRAATADCSRRGQPKIGMTRDQIVATCWGKPIATNRTITSDTVREQLVYSNGYLYLTNGILTTIQDRR